MVFPKNFAVMIMISTFGCNNGLNLAGARVYYTMAKDGLFFRQAGALNKNAVPAGRSGRMYRASILCSAESMAICWI